MFKKYLFIIMTLIVMFSISIVQAVDTNHNETVSKSDPWGAMVYSGTVSVVDTGSGDIYYTQAMLIGCADKDKYAFFDIDCSENGTEDVNVFFETTCTPTVAASWQALTTNSDLDAQGTTFEKDTINVINGTAEVLYQSDVYIRIKFVLGQAHTSGMTITWHATFPKIAALAKSACAGVTSYTE